MNARIVNARIERQGVVVGARAGLARVRLEASPSCSGCGSRGACASAGGQTRIVEVRLAEPAAPGARVTLSLPESSIALAAVLGYLLPAAGLVLGAIAAATAYSGGDLAAVAGAAAGLFGGLLCARLASIRLIPRSGAVSCAASASSLPAEETP